MNDHKPLYCMTVAERAVQHHEWYFQRCLVMRIMRGNVNCKSQWDAKLSLCTGLLGYHGLVLDDGYFQYNGNEAFDGCQSLYRCHTMPQCIATVSEQPIFGCDKCYDKCSCNVKTSNTKNFKEENLMRQVLLGCLANEVEISTLVHVHCKSSPTH